MATKCCVANWTIIIENNRKLLLLGLVNTIVEAYLLPGVVKDIILGQ